jgi:glycosyltransferase involved in cell wall biosynthesis
LIGKSDFEIKTKSELLFSNFPLITVLMSTFNNSSQINNAINSILSQTFGNFEFLIINDASTDNTRDLILSFRDKRIRLIDNEKNVGLTKSLNKGLSLARGKYIARIDADDISLFDRLEKQILFLKRNPEFILLGTSFNIINKKHRVIREVKFNINPENIYYDITFQNLFAHSSVIFRLSDAIALGGYDEGFRFSQDYDLWYKFTRRGMTWILPDILTLWCDEPGNISNKEKKEQQRIYRKIFIDNLKRLGVDEECIMYSGLYFI